MVECSDGTGGCGGWFHPECCNLELSAEQRQKSESRRRRIKVFLVKYHCILTVWNIL